MSKLGPYLRGERPLLDFHDTTDHELVHRHAEGGAWTTVGRGRAGTLREDVQAPLFAHRPGDLVALLAHHGTVSAMWVATGERGLVAAGRVPSSLGPHGMDWLAAWEGEGAQGPAMLAACKGVPRALLVLAACDCVDLALPIMDALDGEPASALSVARAWARGEGRPFANVWAAHHVEECARKMDAERFIPSWAKRPGLVARAAAAAVDRISPSGVEVVGAAKARFNRKA